jgi:DNA-binding NarL/FixJ family response regulator
VAFSADGGRSTERISQTLAEAGCRLEPSVDDDTRVAISAHRRAGAEVCAKVRELRRRSPELAVILVVGQANAGDVRRALQAGAHAVVPEASVEEALVPSIGAALAGQLAFPARTGAAGAPKHLSPREKQILGLVVMGMSNADIAAKLFLAESTVKSHLSSAFSKLGVSSRSEAATVILDPESGGLGILTIPTE